MNINEAFPTKYVRAADLQNQRHTLTIANVVMEEGIDKPIVYFQGRQKGMACNKTNAMMIAQLYGADTNRWIGQQVELYIAQVLFEGKFVPAIRVQAPQPPMPAHQNGPLPGNPGAQPAAPPAQGARTVYPAPDPHAPLPTDSQGGGGYAADPLDDEIPF